MIIIPFTSPEATLENAGGKGANLARLTRAGFDVPRGFIVSTAAYRAFVAENGLQALISSVLNGLDLHSPPDQLEAASAQIRAGFPAGLMNQETESALRAEYAALRPVIEEGAPSDPVNSSAPGETSRSTVFGLSSSVGLSVAVRSSATAEDLPDLSFAGQQDTYLNIIGEAQVLKAVVDCWSSLWTARAIGYRMRNNLGGQAAKTGVKSLETFDSLALAVIVQELVPSEVSGVLFTANPLTGLLSESVVNATFGLGEALVSGQVEPDHFVVDSLSGAINEVTLGAKKISTRGKADGGVENVAETAGGRQTLTDDEIRQLVATGQLIQKEYGAPQDIEWAFVGGKLHILQSRAVTSLFPVPRVSLDPLTIWFSFGSVQGLVGPMTPLGRDAIQHVALGAGGLVGMTFKYGEVDLFAEAGERLWIEISDVLRHPLGNRIISGLLDVIEPSVGQILRQLAAEPRLGAGQGRFKFSTLRRMAHFLGPILPRMARNMFSPASARARFDAVIDGYLAAARILPAADRFGRLANIVAFMRVGVANALPFILPKFIPVLGPSMAGLNILKHFSPDRALDVMRGLPRNVTTEMDLALWQTAQAIGADAAAQALFRETDAAELARRYMGGTLPPAAQAAVTGFMERYGMRGVGEIDLGQPRWREEPTPVMHTLQSYLQIDPAFAPDVLFARGESAALAAVEQIVAEVRQQPGGCAGGFVPPAWRTLGTKPSGWLKEKVVRAAARRIRLMMGVRESPKFFAIRTMGIARQALLEVGQEFVEAGAIERAEDLAFLRFAELEALAKQPGVESLHAFEKGEETFQPRTWKALISERRAIFERELRRRQVPRVLVSDGRAFYEGVGAATDTGEVITGSPVSPGVVEGLVHVVLDPRGTQLAPGEILVCPGTDPAWTPLFMAAGGLVMEVGGMMTHGSVVAREYGIPAVVGVHEATLRLENGQRIRVDGTKGKIVVLQE